MCLYYFTLTNFKLTGVCVPKYSQHTSLSLEWTTNACRGSVVSAMCTYYSWHLIYYTRCCQFILMLTFGLVVVSGKSQELVANASEAVLECSVENEELEVIEMRWRRGNDLINETDKYLTITNGSSSSLIISNPGMGYSFIYSTCTSINFILACLWLRNEPVGEPT